MHPALQPYVDPRPVRTWRYVLAGALVGLLGSRVAIEIAEGGHRCHGESREDVAQVTTKKLAYEAYPQWRMTFWNGPTCPTSGRTAARELLLHVTSAGPDRQFDTADDIGSER